MQSVEVLRQKYPGCVFIHATQKEGSDLPLPPRSHYIVSEALTVGQFSMILRRRLMLAPSKAIFLSVGSTLPSCSQQLSSLQSQHRHEDGIIHMQYSGESTFGCDQDMVRLDVVP